MMGFFMYARKCSGIGILIGGAIVGIAAYQLVDAFDKELEVFTAWTVF